MSFTHYQPITIINPNHKDYFSINKHMELIKLRKQIGLTLIQDCCNYIGLHKLINFDNLQINLSKVFKSLFIGFNYKENLDDYLSWVNDLQVGIEENNIKFLELNYPDNLHLLTKVFLEKYHHFCILEDFLNNRITINEYNTLTKDYMYFEDYPHIFNEEVYRYE